MESDSCDNRIEQDIAKRKQDRSETAGKSPTLHSFSNGAQNKPPQPQKSKSSSRIMPVFEDILKNKAQQPHPPVASTGEKEFVRQMVEKISRPQQQDRSSEIPSLDLGGQILAQQRKIATLKRKSPGQENDTPQITKQQIKPQPVQIQSPLGDGLRQIPPAPVSPQQKIIAEIVAKEILVLTSAR